MKKILMTTVAVLIGGSAWAADLPVLKAPAAAAQPYMWANGFYIGMGVSGSGTNFDVLGNGVNGSINANGTVIDGHISYKYYDGTRYAAITAGCGYDMTMNASAVGGLPNNHLFCTEMVDLGGFLGSIVNISSSPLLPDAFKGAVPFVTVGAAQRMGSSGRLMGVGAVMPLQNAPNWVMGAKYFNVDYSNAQVSPIDVMKTENYVGIFLERKFDVGSPSSNLLSFK